MRVRICLRRLLMRRTLLPLGVCMVLTSLMVACVPVPTTRSNITSPIAATPKAQNHALPSGPAVTSAVTYHKAGEAVKIDNMWQITVNNLKTYRRADYSKPDEG